MSYTLSAMLDEIETTLRDAGNVIWSVDELTRAVRAALVEVSRRRPRVAVTTLAAVSGARELSLSGLPGLLGVSAVWFPYVAEEYPPARAHYTLLGADTLLLEVADAPAAGQTIRLFYLALHSIAGLDGAVAGTLSPELEELVIEGACAQACALCAVDAIGKIGVSDRTPEQWREEAARRLKEWRARLE